MKRLTAIIYPGESKRWLVAFNPETGTTSQGRTVEQALQNLKEATELYLEERAYFGFREPTSSKTASSGRKLSTRKPS